MLNFLQFLVDFFILYLFFRITELLILISLTFISKWFDSNFGSNRKLKMDFKSNTNPNIGFKIWIFNSSVQIHHFVSSIPGINNCHFISNLIWANLIQSWPNGHKCLIVFVPNKRFHISESSQTLSAIDIYLWKS